MTFNIPNDALDERLAFVGTSGSGKTYSAGVIAERGPIAKDEIAERAGVSIKSSGLGAGIRELMDLELIVQENGSYKLAEGLS